MKSCDKVETNPRDVLIRLGDLSGQLHRLDSSATIEECFQMPVAILKEAMSFDVSVVYRVSNVVDEKLILEIMQVHDSKGKRKDLAVGKMLQLDMMEPEPVYVNEIKAFTSRRVSSVNVPNEGCDIMGFVYLPESIGMGYLLGGDFCGPESCIQDHEVSVCEIMCNFISTAVMKSAFEHLSIYDALTGIYNSRKIRAELDQLSLRQLRYPEKKTCIFFCDIDKFKNINDTYGHIQGDVVLKELGSLFSASMRDGLDMVGRYGGEEFLVLISDSSAEKSLVTAERIRNVVQNNKFTRVDKNGGIILGKHLTVTISIGIADNSNNKQPQEWLAQADKALYTAKKEGRNCCRVWSSSAPS
jgi:diguanylate cyclase (GGDEF)-like protein